MMKKLFLCMLSAALVIAAGCDTMKVLENTELFNENNLVQTPEYVLSFHEVVKYPKAEMLEREMETLKGESIYININSYLHSRIIKKVDLVPIKGATGAYDLSITLDKRGKMLWGNLSLQFKKQKVAMLVDGIVYRTFVPEPMPMDPLAPEEPEAVVLIRGPFDANTAGNIVKHSETNYKSFNKK